MIPRPGIRAYFLVMLGLVAAFPVVALGWWQSRELEARSSEKWDQLLVQRATDTADDVQSILSIRLDEIEQLAARAASIKDWSNTSRMRGLFDDRFSAAGFSVLFLGDPWGTSLVASPEFAASGQPFAGINYRDRAYFQRMLRTGRPAIGDAALGRRTRVVNVSLVAPVHTASGELRGWVQGTIELEQLRDRVLANVRHGAAHIVVVDARGVVVVDSDGHPTLKPFLDTPQRGPGGAQTLRSLVHDDQEFRRASAPVAVGGVEWRVYASAPRAEIAEHADAVRNAAAWATGVALLLTMLLAYVSATLASRSLRQLAELATRAGNGDYRVDRGRGWRYAPREDGEVWDAMQTMMRLLDERWRERSTLIANLERANEHSRSLATGLRDAHDGFIVLDRDFHVDYVNPAWERMYARNRDEVIGKPALEFAADFGTAPTQIEDIAATLARRRPWAGPIAFRRGDGSLGEADLSISPVFADDGRVEHYVAMVRDVTGKRQAEHALQQAERLASLGMLAAGVAHEINNPMTYVLGNLEHLSELAANGELVAKPGTDVDVPSCLSDCLHGAHRVIEIVSDLRTLSRPQLADTGASSASALQTLETCLRVAQSQLRHRAELVRALPSEDVHLRINPQRLSQVLLNLILNAAQAMDVGGAARNKLTVSVQIGEDGRGEISVRDTGCGMTPQLVQRIFDPFFTTKGPGLGTGLGLSICHSIITAAGGEILVESGLGEGSCFRVLLPTAISEQSVPVDEPDRLHGLSVLVVDDEPGVLTAIPRMLTQCQTATASSAKQALEMLEHGHFDLVLSDVMMAEHTGIELVHALRERAPELAARVCLMSGGIIGDDLVDQVKAIGVPLLHKPLTRSELHRALWEVHQANQR